MYKSTFLSKSLRRFKKLTFSRIQRGDIFNFSLKKIKVSCILFPSTDQTESIQRYVTFNSSQLFTRFVSPVVRFVDVIRILITKLMFQVH